MSFITLAIALLLGLLNPQSLHPNLKLEFLAKFLVLIWRLLIALLAVFIASSLAFLILLLIVCVDWVKVEESTFNFIESWSWLIALLWLLTVLLIPSVVFFNVSNFEVSPPKPAFN